MTSNVEYGAFDEYDVGYDDDDDDDLKEFAGSLMHEILIVTMTLGPISVIGTVVRKSIVTGAWLGLRWVLFCKKTD